MASDISPHRRLGKTMRLRRRQSNFVPGEHAMNSIDTMLSGGYIWATKEASVRKQVVFAGILWMATAPVFAGTKITVAQLDSTLADMHQQGRTDDAVATKLKDLELTEELAPSVMNSFVKYQPGPQSIVQIRVLALQSAMLPPPAAEIPASPAPDEATQAAIIARAVDYAATQYSHLPSFTAEKSTLRYQNGEEYIRTNNGVGSQMGDSNLGLNKPDPYLRFLGQHSVKITSQYGIELAPANVKKQDPASQNGQISQGGSGPILSTILLDAAQGKLSWLRWEKIDGKQIAVFSFSVDRAKSHYQVDYCCFPKTENVGSHFRLNYATNTLFVDFKTTPGYHGEFFVDPETGTVARMITQAEFKPTDLVQREDSRIDYTRTMIDGKLYVVPTRTVLLTTVIPNGDSYRAYSARQTLFDISYAKYAPAPAQPAGH